MEERNASFGAERSFYQEQSIMGEEEETQQPNSVSAGCESSEIFQPIEELQAQGIGVADIQKLRAAGICSVKGILMNTARAMNKIKGMSEAKVDKIRDVAKRLYNAGFVTAAEYAIKRLAVFKITTGSSDLDRLLGGGVQSMSITEIFGEFRTGKTQLSLTLCVAVQLSGCEGKAAYIDTEGTFRPDRLREIAQRFQLDPDEALDNVIFARAFNSEHQMELITLLAAKFSEEPGKYKLLVVDSIISLFRTDFSGRGELGERQQKLNQMLARLLRISEEYNLAVVVTNQMMADPGAGLTFVPDPKKPIGGHVLAHASTTRISLRKGRNENRIAKIYDSPDMPEAEATFAITTGGIENGTA